MVGGISGYQSYDNYYGMYGNRGNDSIDKRGVGLGANQVSGTQPIGGPNEKEQDGSVKKVGERCQTCESRKYQDGSNENVSFKAAAHVSPEAAAGAVRAHEGEHV